MRSWTLCPFNQWSEIPTERLPEWWAEAVWGSEYPQTNGNSNANSKRFCVCRTILQTSYLSHDARNGDIGWGHGWGHAMGKALEATFHMEDRGRLHWFLGLRIRQEEGKVTVDQERYIETMLERFQMDQCKPSRTPADLNLKLQTAQNGDEEVDQRIYRSLVRSLLYLAKQTMPDINMTSIKEII